ncbi:hypothetical protein QBC47DRAFT_348657 [Echria macrotheca]|uniref:Monooxygenase n=1 Tax=Echria macrotheca TaxID=438768 RepID=A0AAJ0B7X2_9PEZI|nr:hypothetical protein QBC47DRAFT_348657 [Echria macrotheca]
MKSTMQLFPPGASFTRPRANVGSIAALNVLRDNFSLFTWLAIGAFFQGLSTLILPPRYALLPTVGYLTYRLLHTGLMYLGLVRNPSMDDVVMGKYTAQIPGRDGSPAQKPSEQDITVIILAARSNHPFGFLAPGYAKIQSDIGAMIAELNREADKNGYLGESSWISLTEKETSNQVMVLCYFRSVEDLHAFAHGPRHRKAWDWWNKITKDHPHLSIMHEVYHAPKGHWENIYVNNHPTGIANTVARVNIDGQKMRPLYAANMGGLRTHLGRLGRGDGAENEAYGAAPY